MSGVTRPAFLVVDDDRDVVAALAEALNRRFGADYQIIAESSPERGCPFWNGCVTVMSRSPS